MKDDEMREVLKYERDLERGVNMEHRANRERPHTKSGKARRQRAARNAYAAEHGRGQSAPAPFGKEKFVRSGRFGAALARGGHDRSIFSVRRLGQAPDGSIVERPRKQKSYDLSGLKVGELRDLAARRGLKGLYTAKKAALIAAIERSRF